MLVFSQHSRIYALATDEIQWSTEVNGGNSNYLISYHVNAIVGTLC